MVITEVACGINCTQSTALFNKYGLDCTATEHTLDSMGFQVTKSESLLCCLLSVFKRKKERKKKKKQCKSKVLELTPPPSGMFVAIVFPSPSYPPFVSEMKVSPGKLSKPLVTIIMETKQRRLKRPYGKAYLSEEWYICTFSVPAYRCFL